MFTEDTRKNVLFMGFLALVVVCMTLLAAMGKVDASAFVNFVTVTIPTWIGANGLAVAAKNYNPVGTQASPLVRTDAAHEEPKP